MEKQDICYQTYIEILREELIPAMGCTEPIALAYAAAKARELLHCCPERVKIQVSGSIIKNVKSVIVPNTGHLKGIEAAVAVGIIAGDPQRELEVISQVSDKERQEMNRYLEEVKMEIQHIEKGPIFDIILTEYAGESHATIRISNHHTNIVYLEKDGEVLLDRQEAKEEEPAPSAQADRTLLCMEGIWDFVQSVDIQDIKDILERQIQYNSAIAEEGLIGDYGANIGSVLLSCEGYSVRNRAKARAAAASDARMNGCELPVVINSGSGNQGITCSVPLLEYAKELHCGKEKLYRALALSNLIAIYEKGGIGTLSAYCGAVSAGAGAGAGIAYLNGGDYQAIIHTVVNALAIVSGIVCDGAKASCAAKIAASVDAGILGYQMYMEGQEFKSGEGIVMKDIESTIRGIGRLGKDGMRGTNEEIIRMMIE